MNSPREATSSAAGQEITLILWNHKIHYFYHKIQPLVPALSLLNRVEVLISYLCKALSNIILPSTLGSYSWFFPSESSPSLPPKSLYTYLLSSTPATFPAHLMFPSFHHLNNIWWGTQVLSFPITQSHPPSFWLKGAQIFQISRRHLKILALWR